MFEEHEFIRRLSSFERVKNGVIFHCITSQDKKVDIQLTVCTHDILRLQMCPDKNLKRVKGLLEIREDWPVCGFTVEDNVEAVSVKTGSVAFEARRDPWKYTIHDRAGEVVLEENVRDLDAHMNHRSLPIGFTTRGERFLRSNETFNLPPGENFFGLGEKFTRLNKLGQSISGWNKNPYGAGTGEVYKHIPFFMSSRGYGIFVNTTYRLTCDMGSKSLMTYTIMVDDPRLDLFIIYGPSLKDVLARYMEITGWPALPPKESFGIWQTPRTAVHSLENRAGATPPEERLKIFVETAEKYRELDIPVDIFGLVVRFTSSEDETREMSEALGRFGVKIGMYVAPLLNVGTDLEREARENGYAVTHADGTPYEVHLGMKGGGERGETEYSLAMIERDDDWRSRHNHIFYEPCLMPDFTNPEAVNWWKGKIIERMRAGCFCISMSDFGEDVPSDGHFYNKRTGLEMHNLYTLLYQKASFEAVAEGTGHRGLVNARSGTAGMQRFPICWSGDPNCEWEDMLADMRAGLSIGLSGVPFWSCDNGGYCEAIGSRAQASELWIRWTQWTMFQSHVRLHGTEPPRTPWSYGERALENFRRYAKLRYRLLPYIYSTAYDATITGLPIMRAMVLEFQDDPNTFNIEDQYMFGDAFLVAPVFTPTKKRTVYLPCGTWFDYWTGKEHHGPEVLHIEPALEELPLFVRDDSIIPMGPDMAYIGEKPLNPITLDIWIRSEAAFTIYDDDEKADASELITCRAKKTGDGITLDLSASKRTFIAKFNNTGCPAKVCLNEVDLPKLTSIEDLYGSEHGWCFDPPRTVYAKFDSRGSRSQLTC